MCLFSWRRLKGLSAALVAVGVGCVATARGAEYYPGGEPDVAALEARLDAYEAELRALKAQSGVGTQFTSAANAALAEEAADEGPLKKVEIITKPTYKIIGRIFADHLMIDQQGSHSAFYGNAQNRTRFDTARIGVEGNVFETVKYKFEMAIGEVNNEFTVGASTFNIDEPVAKDIYVEVTELALLQNVRIGHFKEPFSLEELTSSRFITFMERSYLNTFAPARNMGIMEYGHVFDDETLSWYTGLFRSEIGDSPVDELEDRSDWAWTSRVAWNPIYDEPSGGRYLVHLGAAYSWREIGDEGYTIRKDHELNHVFPVVNPISETVASSSDVQLFGLEAAAVYGPLHASAEWTSVAIGRPDGALGDIEFNACYAQVGWFLTGEHKGYKKESHAFDRTKVLEPVFCVRTSEGCCHGWGAWELKARWSMIDANDGVIIGGRAEGFSTGLNWYLNDYCRMMCDYVIGDSESDPTAGLDRGDVHQVGLRAQVDW
jgi:phosphate-selective porin OprO/OprP